MEVRGYKQAGEQVITYPHPSVKLTNGRALTNAQFLHRDHLSSVRAITNSAGTVVERAVYKPFGEQSEWLSASQPAPETKGWIGERFDADAGLQYLNARYYDPVLGMFLQPDWWEVTTPGVGTNRFSYSFNDPVNASDPSGNQQRPSVVNGWRNGARSLKESQAMEKNARKNGVLGDNGTIAAPGSAWGGCCGTRAGAGRSVEKSSIPNSGPSNGPPPAKGPSNPTGKKADPAQGNGGRGANHNSPDPKATGPHSTYRTNDAGKVTSYETYSRNPRNPTGFDSTKRVDTQYSNGSGHFNKTTGKTHDVPHVHDKIAPGKVRDPVTDPNDSRYPELPN